MEENTEFNFTQEVSKPDA